MSYYDEIKDARNEWIAEHCIGKCCAICRTFTPRLDCHEMHSRARAPRQWAHPCNYLPVCRTLRFTRAYSPRVQPICYAVFVGE